MRKIALSLAALGAVVVPFLYAAPAQAQATRTWVSAGTGSDSNACSRLAPCFTFAGALSKTQDKGEINCVDAGGYGSVVINKSITIDCTGTYASVLAGGVSGIIVTGANVNVILRGLTINGTEGSGANPGLAGIRFIGSGTLHVDNVNVQNFTNAAAGAGRGIDFNPNAASKLMVTNSHLVNNGNIASGGGGVYIKPAAGSVSAILKNVNAERGYHGIVADATGPGGSINLIVMESVAHGNAGDGIVANSAGTGVSVTVDRSAATANSNGLRANGSDAAVIRVSNSVIAANAVATSAAGGGQVLSYLNNDINANGMDTTPPNVPGGQK